MSIIVVSVADEVYLADLGVVSLVEPATDLF